MSIKNQTDLIEMISKRDGMTVAEVRDLISETTDEILSDMENADEILMDNLGIEPDYLEIVLNF